MLLIYVFMLQETAPLLKMLFLHFLLRPKVLTAHFLNVSSHILDTLSQLGTVFGPYCHKHTNNVVEVLE